MSVERAQLHVAELTRRFDGWILVATLALVSLGALMVYSATTSLGTLARQGTFTGIGLICLAVGTLVPYRKWHRLATPVAAVTILLLVALLIPHVGTSSNGAQRWFQYKGITLEPSELAKIALTLYFAVWLSKKGAKIRSFKDCTAPFGLILALVCMLVVIQPDLGTAAVIACAMVIMFFIAGARLDHLGLGIATGFVLALGAISFESYRNARIKVWLNPWNYAHNLGFQTAHALEALGSGGIFGEGLGNSHQKFVLPAASTDSIMAVAGEELGFIGTSLIVLLFVILAWRGFNAARNAPDLFGRLLAVGITSTIVVQAFLNIAVITNSVPFTGVPLPFISYGGSSLIVCLFSVGILLNISREASRPMRVSGGAGPLNGKGRNEDRSSRRKDRRPRLSGSGRRRLPAPVPAGVQIIQIRGTRERVPRYG